MPGIVTNTVEDVEGGCGSPPQGNAEKNNGGAEACQIDKAMPTESKWVAVLMVFGDCLE